MNDGIVRNCGAMNRFIKLMRPLLILMLILSLTFTMDSLMANTTPEIKPELVLAFRQQMKGKQIVFHPKQFQ
jgi:hypothetical protein